MAEKESLFLIRGADRRGAFVQRLDDAESPSGQLVGEGREASDFVVAIDGPGETIEDGRFLIEIVAPKPKKVVTEWTVD